MSKFLVWFVACLCLLLAVVLAAPVRADDAEKEAAPATPEGKRVEGALPAAWSDVLAWRSIGPANMGGRITSVAVYAKQPTTWWAATASGGLLKTVNDGTTFEHQLDREAAVSVGSVAVAQTDPKIVWVGTGESNPRNSVSWGNGVYKSVDGGSTWTHMGLEKTFQISSVRIHPENPDIVYVGAMGRCWGTNPERGLFKTTDGGTTWKKIHYVDEKTGVIEVRLSPADPDTLLVATWERQRDGFDTNDPAKKWGPGSGVWRSTDGGASFERVTKGLPTGAIGRVGIDFSRKDPSVVFMVLESEKIGTTPPESPFLGINGEDAEVGCRLTRVTAKGPSDKAGLKPGDIILAVDGDRVMTYRAFVKRIRKAVAGDTVTLEVVREKETHEIALTLGQRPEAQRKKEAAAKTADTGPRRGPSPFSAMLGGQQANMQDEQGASGHEYGGIYKSADGGVSWTRVNSLNPRPMYFSEIRVDPQDDQRIYVLGVRLWRSKDGGATFTPDGHDGRVHVDHHAMWVDPDDPTHIILGNDGGIYVTRDRMANWDHLNHVAIGQFYHVGIGPRLDYRVYGGLQDNGSWGGPSRVRHGRGPSNTDWFRVGGGDGFRCLVDRNDAALVYFESQNGGIGRRHLQSGERAGMRPRPPRGSKTRYRFNWQTPFLLSHHNSRIYYVAGNHVFRSLDRGNGMRRISPEITLTKRGSATALAESPRDPDLLYVGTDDGAFWVTRDAGHTWTDLYAEVPAAPKQPKPPAPKATAGAGANGNGHDDRDEEADAPAPEGKDDKPKADDPKPTSDDDKPKSEGDDADKPAETPEADEPADDRPSRAQRMLDRLMQMDANGDGKLQRSEAPERLGRLFDRADTDKDGVLTKEEILASGPRRRTPEAPPGGGDTPAPADETPKAAPKTSPKDGSKPIRELMPDRRWVSWIEPSRFKAARAYLVFDGHRSDDDRPHLFATENGGRTWRSIVSNLPASAGTTRVLREDLKNQDVLYLGTEMGAWVSIDRGSSWTRLGDLPTVAVHAFALHPTAGEIVAGTHGRSLWVLDVSVLRQLKPSVVQADVHLFRPKTAIQWRTQPRHGAARAFVGQNPTSGAVITYSLKAKATEVAVRVKTLDGTLLRELEAKTEAGLHRVGWNLRGTRPAGRQGQFRQGPRVEPGTYQVELEVGGKTFTQPLVVDIDPDHLDPRWIGFANAAEEAEAERAYDKWLKKYAPFQGED